MEFIKKIPHQCAKSPRITNDYFDTEALRLMSACKLYGINIYHSVVTCIIGNKPRIHYAQHINEFIPLEVIGHLRAIGFDAKYTGYIDHTGSLPNIIIDLNNKPI